MMSPSVALRLKEFARDDEPLAEVAATLSHSQLTGRSMLPEFLPFVPSMSEVVASIKHGAAAARLRLRAALDVTQRPEIVLAASAVDSSVLLLGPLQRELKINEGVLEFEDERLRSWAVQESSPTERRTAYAELARAANRAGYREAAWFYTARSADLGRQRSVSQAVLKEATCQLRRGYTRNAYLLARSVIDNAQEAPPQALAICGRAAFWHGCFDEARFFLSRVDDDDALIELSYRLERGPDPDPDNRKRGVEVAAWLAEVAEARADAEAMQDIGTLTVLWYSEQFDECDSFGAQMLLKMAALGKSNGWAAYDERLTPLAEAQMCALKAGVEIQGGYLEDAAQTISEAIPRQPLEHSAAGVIPKFIRLLAEADVPIDVSLADEYDALIGLASEKHKAFGPVAGERFVAAARALAGHTTGESKSPQPVQEFELEVTPRQQAVLGLVLQGMTNREISEVLHISNRTVEVHVAALLRKLKVDSRSKLIARVMQLRDSGRAT